MTHHLSIAKAIARYCYSFLKTATLSENELRTKLLQSSVPPEHQTTALQWLLHQGAALPDRAVPHIIGNIEALFSFDHIPKPLNEIANPAQLNEVIRTARQAITAERPKELETVVKNLNMENQFIEIFPYANPNQIKNLQLFFMQTFQNPENFQDIPEQYKAITVLWLKKHIGELIEEEKTNVARYNFNEHQNDYEDDDYGGTHDPGQLLEGAIDTGVKVLEKFFLFNNYARPQYRDLFKITSWQQLKAVVDDAVASSGQDEGKLRGARYKKKIEKGLEKLGEDEDWEVYAPHNKEAACHIGSGTNWCTSARGENNMFSDYYQPDDQLYVFVNKKNPEEKYQFHYGTEQFMDKADHQIKEAEIVRKLHGLLDGILDPAKKSADFEWKTDKENIKQLTSEVKKEKYPSDEKRKELASTVNSSFMKLHSENLDDEKVKERLSYLLELNPLLYAQMEAFELPILYKEKPLPFVLEIRRLMNIANNSMESIDSDNWENAAVAAQTILDAHSERSDRYGRELARTNMAHNVYVVLEYMFKNKPNILKEKSWQNFAQNLLDILGTDARSEELQEDYQDMKQRFSAIIGKQHS